MRPSKPLPIIPRKNLGQNFLQDKNIIRKIIDACCLKPSDHVLEVGPGLGALTQQIAPKVQSFCAIEKDKRLADQLRQDPCLRSALIINEDILDFCFPSSIPRVKIIGNLPYNISSPIIERFIENRTHIHEAFVMVQKEFGMRLIATAGEEDYSALSCAVQYYAHPEILFKIKNTAFIPAPKVESVFLKISFRSDIHPCAKNETLFRYIIRIAFQQRRKKLINALGVLAPKSDLDMILKKARIDRSQRAENLSTNDYVTLSNVVEEELKDLKRPRRSD
ncbi:MAG TPA: 16S rRNA (adenine(1518)-N(6)/adenine(1519)-N(6))-dimethyltransferase RsmA [Candidatus Omnitrophota bacterium]|nr:16S rRNA (adenine(1518)-N(6)/adenine(1519)-N(6))-dimethyltransferase RsmA [Candidatus Omnitrophota bacterium]